MLLPPTSHSVRNGHIKRWWYFVSEMKKLMTDGHNYKPENPTDAMDGEKTPVSSFHRNFSIPCQNILCLFAFAKAQQIQGAQEDVPAQNKT